MTSRTPSRSPAPAGNRALAPYTPEEERSGVRGRRPRRDSDPPPTLRSRELAPDAGEARHERLERKRLLANELLARLSPQEPRRRLLTLGVLRSDEALLDAVLATFEAPGREETAASSRSVTVRRARFYDE